MLQALSLWQSIEKGFLCEPMSLVDDQRFVMQLAGMLNKTDQAQSKEADQMEYVLILHEFFEAIFGNKQVGSRSNGSFKHLEVVAYHDASAKVIGLLVPPDQRISMISRKQLKKEVFFQAIQSYLAEYFLHENQQLNHILITNLLEWYVFDVKDLQKWLCEIRSEEGSLWEDLQLSSRQYEDWRAIIENYWSKISEKLPASCVNLYGLHQQLKTPDEAFRERLFGLNKFFSATHLLKIPFQSNRETNAEVFFQELLHLLGVEEVLQKGGARRLREKQIAGEEGLWQAFLQKLQDKSVKEAAELGDIAWKDCIYAICQLLIQKTMEARQKAWNQEEELSDTIEGNQSFADFISTIFPLPSLASYTPVVSLAALDDSITTRIYQGTVLMDSDGNSRQYEHIALNSYVGLWLEAYELRIDYQTRLQEDKIFLHLSELIRLLGNLSALGVSTIPLPAELLHSFCQKPVRKAVIHRFNAQYSWNCQTFEELEVQIEQIPVKAANACMDQLTICHLAAANGSILIQTLREWIWMKVQLGILCDARGELLPRYTHYITSDDYWLISEEGKFCNHQADDQESLRLREAVSHELTHVLTRVFLGLEEDELSMILAYTRVYLEYLRWWGCEVGGDILPNLSNNLRLANALVSRFPLDMDIQQALKPTPYGFEDYKYVVQLMKIARSSTEIAETQQMLRQFKQLFRAHVSSNDRRHKRLERLEQTYHKEFMTLTLLDFRAKEGDRENKKKEITIEIERLKAELQAESQGIWYENAFEWRLEFPEVLDANGNFTGFDLLLCRPPNIRQEKMGHLRHYFKRNYKTYNYQANIFMYFVELGVNLLKAGGRGVWILPNVWMTAQYTRSLRDWVMGYSLETIEEIEDKGFSNQSLVFLKKQQLDLQLQTSASEKSAFSTWIENATDL